MDTRDRPITDLTTQPLPRIGLLTMFRLGLFQMGLGMMSLLTLGIVNRIAIDELRVPALIATGAIAMERLVSPARVFFGQLSDSKPLFGRHSQRLCLDWGGTLHQSLLRYHTGSLATGSEFANPWHDPPYLWLGRLVCGLFYALWPFHQCQFHPLRGDAGGYLR